MDTYIFVYESTAPASVQRVRKGYPLPTPPPPSTFSSITNYLLLYIPKRIRVDILVGDMQHIMF